MITASVITRLSPGTTFTILETKVRALLQAAIRQPELSPCSGLVYEFKLVFHQHNWQRKILTWSSCQFSTNINSCPWLLRLLEWCLHVWVWTFNHQLTAWRVSRSSPVTLPPWTRRFVHWLVYRISVVRQLSTTCLNSYFYINIRLWHQ